ncbi:MAG: DNA recombination protein RmuC, partial [Bacteroidetes bacterium]
MVALLIGLIALVGIGIYVIFQQQRRHQEEIRKQLEQIQERDIIIADLKERAIRAESETESLKKLLEENKKFSDEKQKDLREQLELLGKDFVTQGSRILKSENELQLGTLLKPLKERLEAFEKEVRENNKQDIERFSSMEGLVKALSEQHHKMHSTAQNLVDALKGEQKVQGDWGELALERILESSGLEKGREYFIQNSYRNESGELQRPDVIVQLPEDK